MKYMLKHMRKSRKWRKKHHCDSLTLLHTLIIVDMSENPDGLTLYQSIEWPVLYMDASSDAPIKSTRELCEIPEPLRLDELISCTLIDLVEREVLNVDGLIEDIKNATTEKQNDAEDIIKTFVDMNIDKTLLEAILEQMTL